jgi:hypothetical protein
MNKHVLPKLTRRGFVIGTAAAGAGLAIGLDIPFGGPTVVRAADGSPEVNVWVVRSSPSIRPPDKVSHASAPGAISRPAAAAASAPARNMSARAAPPHA